MKKEQGYRIWECKIVVLGERELPDGFDSPPRRAAIEAVEKHGIEVISCFSGWGGRLTKTEKEMVDRYTK